MAISCAQAPTPEESDADIDDIEPPESAIIDAGASDAKAPRDGAMMIDPPPAKSDANAGPVGPGARDADVADAPPPHDASNDEEPTTPDDAAAAPADAQSEPAPDAAMEPRDAGSPPPPPVDAGGSEGSVDSGVRDAGAQCIPGVYAGAFSGEISALLGFVRIDITGIISIEIGAEGATQMLQIRNGKLDGQDQDGNPITATITGTLSCATRRLENGRISEGTYRRKDPVFGGPERTVGFTGSATAVYNLNPPSATGQWEVVNANGLRSGSGSWSTTLQR